MVDTTANRGYRHPEATDHARVWEHVTDLASDVDTDVQALVDILLQPHAQISETASSAAVGTSETTVLTVPSSTYGAGRCYEIQVRGAYNMSTGSAYPSFLLRKTSSAGAVITDFGPRLPAPGASGLGFRVNLSEYFAVGGSDVTAALVVTLAASSGTVTMVGNAQHPRRVLIFDRGPASAYDDLPLLS